MPEASSGNGKVALHYGEGSQLDLPVKSATQGSDGIEVTKVLATTGMVTLDPGFVNTAACSSDITYIDGDAGILRYRGYPIEQLAEKSTFLEVSYLLIYGALPTTEQLADFTEKVQHHTLLDEDFKTFFSAFPRNAHPMAVLSSAVSALSSFYPGHLDPHNDEDVELSMIRLLAKVPTLGAYFYKRSIGQPYLYPDNSLSLAENFLRMTFGFPSEDYQVDPEVAKALDVLFVLHADHEQNCSTSTVRVVGSSEANVFTSHLRRASHALSGPLHGGANAGGPGDAGPDIREQGGDVKASYVERVKNKEPGVKLMGFGHRVYKNYDPRGRIVKKSTRPAARQAGARTTTSSTWRCSSRKSRSADDYFVEPQALPERRLLHRPHLPGDGLPDRDVHGAVRDRPHARLARALQGDAARPGDQDRPAPAGLQRPGRARLPGGREALIWARTRAGRATGWACPRLVLVAPADNVTP